MNRIKLAVIAGGALFATPVFAQDATEPAAGGEAAAGAEVTTPTTGAEVTAGATGAVSMAWSRSVIDRPYVLNKGKIGAYGQYAIAKASFDLGMGMTVSATGDGFGVGAGYGVTDKITAGLQYGFTPGIIGDADSELKGQLDLFGEFQISRSAKMDITASANFSMDLCGGVDAMGDCVSAMGINAGLGARYNIAPKMAAFTGAPYGPGPVGQHLSISLEDGNAMSFAIPVGFMYQATPELNVHLTTELGRIAFNDAAGESAFIGADYFQLGIGGLYSVTPNIDVTGMFLLPDLKEAQFDLYAFALGARWYN
jgi:long-subunit fatty acid transport protein